MRLIPTLLALALSSSSTYAADTEIEISIGAAIPRGALADAAGQSTGLAFGLALRERVWRDIHLRAEFGSEETRLDAVCFAAGSCYGDLSFQRYAAGLEWRLRRASRGATPHAHLVYGLSRGSGTHSALSAGAGIAWPVSKALAVDFGLHVTRIFYSDSSGQLPVQGRGTQGVTLLVPAMALSYRF